MKTRNFLFALFAVVASVASTSSAWAADLAKVNGKPITERDLSSALGNLNEGQREKVLKDVNTRRRILDGVIEQELLAQEGEKQKIDQEADYKTAVAAFRKNFLASRVLQKSIGNKLTDSAAKKYYEAHKNDFSTEQVHAQHILVSDEAQARDILKQAKAKDADFQALAEKFSKDPSAKNNRGDLGYFGRDAAFIDEFKNAAFGGKVGEIVGPIKTEYGYHVIKVVDKKSGKPLEYDEVELRVKGMMRQELAQQYVANLKKQAKIEVDQKAIDKM